MFGTYKTRLLPLLAALRAPASALTLLTLLVLSQCPSGRQNFYTVSQTDFRSLGAYTGPEHPLGELGNCGHFLVAAKRGKNKSLKIIKVLFH